VIAGYLAARALFGDAGSDGYRLVESLATRTTSLSGTLLRLAAQGQLPEAAHRLLEEGDPERLLSWGATSGSGLLAGLGLFAGIASGQVVRTLDLTIPLGPIRPARIEVREISAISAIRLSRAEAVPAP
jgi:hypothetical protein